MGSICKLVIKACSDNKFSSLTGEFTAFVNPEDIVIKSGVDYAVAQGSGHASALRYYQSPARLLSFKLFFDNTGVIPGSNSKISVTEQLERLQSITYDIQDKINAPNYIRVIWGKIDFKGRLMNLEINYTMFQTDGTLIRAEACISVIEEKVLTQQGQNIKKGQVSKEGDNHQEGVTQRTNGAGDPPVGKDGAVGGLVGKDGAVGGPVGKDGAVGGSVNSESGGKKGDLSGESSKSTHVASKGGQAGGAVGSGKGLGDRHSENRSYKTKGGDTLPKLSKEHLGDKNAVKKYATLNKLNRLRPLPTGSVLETLGGLSVGLSGLAAGLLVGSKLSWLKKFIKKEKEKGKVLIQKGKSKSQNISQKGKTGFQKIVQTTKETVKKVTKK